MINKKYTTREARKSERLIKKQKNEEIGTIFIYNTDNKRERIGKLGGFRPVCVFDSVWRPQGFQHDFPHCLGRQAHTGTKYGIIIGYV